MRNFTWSIVFAILLLCSCSRNKAAESSAGPDVSQTSQTEMPDTMKAVNKITAEMAYEGVNNYCHSEYDWSTHSSMMYVEMGDETETEYKVIFRSYTGAFIYFYVGKTSGSTRMVEYVPSLDIENEAGTINLFDYLEKD